MADYQVKNGEAWLQPFQWGQPNDRWRLDDYHIYMQLKIGDDVTIRHEASTLNGGIIITDAVARRMEVNVAWADIAAAGAGPFVFDFLFINKTTAVREHSEIFTLEIVGVVTENPEA